MLKQYTPTSGIQIFIETTGTGRVPRSGTKLKNSHEGVVVLSKEKYDVSFVDLDKEQEKIRKDFMKQLELRDMTQTYYISLVDDYISLWKIKNSLVKDINDRGVSVQYNNGGGQSGFKKNDSVPELNKVIAQMLKILSELGLRGADIKAVEEDEEL